MDLVQGQACSLHHQVKAQRLQSLPGRTQQHARLHPVQQPCKSRKLHRQLGKKGCCAMEGSPAAIAAEPSSSSVASNVSSWHCCSHRWLCTAYMACIVHPIQCIALQICQTGIPQSRVWELDFSSRPILDERGKKKWELLICDAQRQFQYSGYFPNNKINSTQVGLPHLPVILCIAALPSALPPYKQPAPPSPRLELLVSLHYLHHAHQQSAQACMHPQLQILTWLVRPHAALQLAPACHSMICICHMSCSYNLTLQT